MKTFISFQHFFLEYFPPWLLLKFPSARQNRPNFFKIVKQGILKRLPSKFRIIKYVSLKPSLPITCKSLERIMSHFSLVLSINFSYC